MKLCPKNRIADHQWLAPVTVAEGVITTTSMQFNRVRLILHHSSISNNNHGRRISISNRNFNLNHHHHHHHRFHHSSSGTIVSYDRIDTRATISAESVITFPVRRCSDTASVGLLDNGKV